MTRLISTPALALAAVALLAGGCNFTHAEARDAGPAVDRSYQVASFDRITVSGPYEVTVKTGGQPGVKAHGGEAILAETDIIVENGELKIVPKKKNDKDPPAKLPPIPAKYGDPKTTPLTATVKEGKNTFDIQLSD